MKDESTRELIVKAADKLFYQRGYSHTSFSDIADDVKISRGNFYYHFKTKDDILDAVIHARLSNLRTLLAKWEAEGKTPVERICYFARTLIVNQTRIMRSGCPIGTLWTELMKLDHESRGQASAQFMLFRSWLREQFALLGKESEADILAMHLLSRTQGVAMLASAFADEAFIQREVDGMCEWVESVARTAS
ncbi:TetR/AcrR family transcriptional regulator [Trinickia acidisoli]|uniref:TetR/AcrR family transcriptional regulator n=1 Tax=Trinickia acidisoli TaxID=2767482 RepID=UPI001A8E2AC8|nr:TetR/AcrR family transcriptional regulator [Trinickia acidisoli]